ncbi:hypothetical protein [Sinobaca sp. H24]|uniref:hypothetical protein n=1 Tax=Sinobaca sp. H24 TaxID=2923376 RepID=UPI00207AB338|nr:hypothetical protein [Sinobaca sp. H24]
MKKMISDGRMPEALFAASDSMALERYERLEKLSPHTGRYSSSSFNDVETAAYMTPALTTIKVHKKEWEDGAFSSCSNE